MFNYFINCYISALEMFYKKKNQWGTNREQSPMAHKLGAYTTDPHWIIKGTVIETTISKAKHYT